MRIGRYLIRAELSGFKPFSQQGLVLNIGDVRKLDIALQLGDLSETVTVEATVPLLNAADSTVGQVITNQQIKDLPLNGRDYLQLAALSSGTASTGGVGISIGGQAGSQVAFLLDGQDNNNQQISTGHSNQKEVLKPSIDAIQEFKVVTNGYAAEYGRSSSGVISVSLKSGSNRLSGAVYEYFRHDAMDARNFFATEKPPSSATSSVAPRASPSPATGRSSSATWKTACCGAAARWCRRCRRQASAPASSLRPCVTL